jgi:hypothetical protein
MPHDNRSDDFQQASQSQQHGGATWSSPYWEHDQVEHNHICTSVGTKVSTTREWHQLSSVLRTATLCLVFLFGLISSRIWALSTDRSPNVTFRFLCETGNR